MNLYVNVNSSHCNILYKVFIALSSSSPKTMMKFYRLSSIFHSPPTFYLWLCVLSPFASPALELVQTHIELVWGMKPKVRYTSKPIFKKISS